ncbi:hypothetical protein C8J55DRAFT_516398 [Lentinula edodes]|uniref:GRF-type domain-containing protein n=1 Tax=Lentinula lateritia TaxID=40482 RepID=A0A9W9DMB3_9AGAR|nr:hypothetical protein C8J55DRAFT_516398 [Lentinula edodes]
MSVNRIIHVSPVDYSGTVRCYTHELEAIRRISQTEGNSNREFYLCPKGPEDRCDFFFWVDQLTAGTPHQLPAMSQNNSSTPSRTPQAPRTPSKTRMDAIQEALAEKKPDSRANGNNSQFTTPSSSLRAHAVKTPGQLKRDEEIKRALETPTRQSAQLQRNDASVFQSSQPPPANFKLTPLSQGSSIHSDEDDAFDALPLTPPTSQRYKRSRNQESNEESEPDSFRSSPSRNKGKKKANLPHDWITPTSAKADTDVFTASPRLVGIIESLEEFREQVIKLERQMKALSKSNEAKLEKIRHLETDNHSLKLENDNLRGRIRQLENY